jgi:succinate dehydrogenase/fumarate reductase flavoprotein subunit
MSTFDVIETDILVVGSEAGGARAAIEAYDRGAKVILCTKSLRGRSGVTLKAVFSVAAAFGFTDPRDNWEEHLKDTIVGGRHLCNQKLAKIYAEEGPAGLDQLGKWGVSWDKAPDGRYRQVKVYGHTFPRSLSVGFRVGVAFVNCFKQQLNQREVATLNDMFIQEYLTDENGRIAGAFAIDIRTGRFLVIKAKAIIDATGGAMDLYKNNTGTPESTGDGMAMAYRLGAELVDTEFVQFYPIGLYDPPSLFGDEAIPAMTRLWLNGVLYNYAGERFMTRYDPVRMEFADRDALSIAIWKEMRAGRGVPGTGGVWLDTSYHSARIIDRVIADQAPGWKMRGVDMLEMGLDLRKDALIVGPEVHFYCGGIKVDERWASDIPGLFVCGEAVGGVHGANRLPGGALTETQVSAVRAANHAVDYGKNEGLKNFSQAKVDDLQKRVEGIARREKGPRPIKMLREIQELMWSQVGILRTKEGLEKAVYRIEEMRQDRINSVCPGIKGKQFNHELVEALEVENALLMAEAIAKAGLMRTESRGNHQREDYPETKDEWLKNIYVQEKNGKMTLTARPVIKL